MKDKRSLSVVVLCLFLMVGMSWEVGAWNKMDYQRLMATKKCVKCDLTEAYLSEANLFYTNLSAADLSAANLTGADLKGANLTETKMCETKMPNGIINNSGC